MDRLVGLRHGTARRWIDGYHRGGTDYPPILRAEPTGSDSVTWGEMVEGRLLAEFRNLRVPVRRLRPAVERLRAEPSIRGVRTEVLAEEYRAGESRESLADLYDLDPEQVDQALRYELIASSAQAG